MFGDLVLNFLCPFVMHHLVWTLSFTQLHAMYLVLIKLSKLFVISWSDFWLDSLIQNSIAQGEQVNISPINEVLTRHQSLAGDGASLHNGFLDLCLEIFKEYPAIMDWVAKNYSKEVEVRIWHKRILTKWRKSRRKIGVLENHKYAQRSLPWSKMFRCAELNSSRLQATYI